MTYTLDDDTAGTADHNRRAALVAELEQPGDVTTAARDAAAGVFEELAGLRLELEELRELADIAPRFLHALANQSRLRAERMRHRPGTKPHKLAEAIEEAEQLDRALELARKWSPMRARILEKAGSPAA